MRKRVFVFVVILVFFLLSLVLSVSAQDAINLEINKEAVNDVIVRELSSPANFELSIKNNGPSDSFEIYSLVGLDIFPKDGFFISTGETKKIKIEVRPSSSLKINDGYFSFAYKIKGASTGIQEDRLTLKITGLKNVLGLSAENINPDSEKTTIYLENREKIDFSKIEAEFSSAFFSKKETFKLLPLEIKSFEITLDKEKLGGLTAGPYILVAKLKTGETEGELESTIHFLEQSNILTIEKKEGWLVYRYEIEKTNEGNVPAVVQTSLTKWLFSRIFTNFNTPFYKKETHGLSVTYTWQKELRPGDSLNVVARTNWFVPILLAIAIVVIIILWRKYAISDIILKKRIGYVRTKGGEFALKVSILVKARRYAEKIRIIDKLPPVLKLYERYGTIAPDRIDEKNRRVEWNIESLNEYEETILSYIVYSKIGIVGKFELPPATAIYERDGDVKEASSNRVFFLSEKRKLLVDKHF